MGETPYFDAARKILPDDLFEKCSHMNVSDPDHPFAADFETNARLLARANPAFTFIDLFAGVGGFRIAMQQEGGLCTFSSEIDKGARATYRDNFGIIPFGDITKDSTKDMIPKSFDVLCGGFPCQAFSLAGLRKGFEDTLQRGTLYRQIVQIAQEHQPKAIFCENVKGLLSSAEGQALQTITHDMEDAGYHIVFDNILDSLKYGVPQHRERLYIVALRNDLYEIMRQRNLAFPAKPEPIPGQHPHAIGDILEEGPVPKSYYLGQNYLNTLIRHRARHADAGTSGFGYIVRERTDIAGTLMCGGMGRERNMIHDENQPDWEPTPKMLGGMNDQHLRFLTVREWARLQGFPDYFTIPTSIQAGYKQFGNCVTVKTVRAVGRAILNLIAQCEEETEHE
jgi:DNA (cytosine-5)-methyltransferase 1